MKKAISFILLFTTFISVFSACSSTKSNKEVTVDVSVFSELNCESDEFTGISFYYPNVPGRGITKEDFTRFGSSDTVFYISPNYSEKNEFTVLPVIRYNPNSDIPYQLECVMQYHYTFWDSHKCFSFDQAVIVTDNHRYNISQITKTSGLDVMGAASIVPLGSIGMDMVKDICSSGSVSIRLTGTSDSKDIEVDSAAFKSVLEVINLYEVAGCGQYNFSAIDANITMS